MRENCTLQFLLSLDSHKLQFTRKSQYICGLKRKHTDVRHMSYILRRICSFVFVFWLFCIFLTILIIAFNELIRFSSFFLFSSYKCRYVHVSYFQQKNRNTFFCDKTEEILNLIIELSRSVEMYKKNFKNSVYELSIRLFS